MQDKTATNIQENKCKQRLYLHRMLIDNDTMQEQDTMAKDFSKRHWQAFKAKIEKRKQIQTQIAVIHNV